MTVQEAIRVLESHGWQPVAADAPYHLFRHEALGRIITLAGKPELDLPPGVLRVLWRYAQIAEAD